MLKCKNNHFFGLIFCVFLLSEFGHCVFTNEKVESNSNALISNKQVGTSPNNRGQVKLILYSSTYKQVSQNNHKENLQIGQLTFCIGSQETETNWKSASCGESVKLTNRNQSSKEGNNPNQVIIPIQGKILNDVAVTYRRYDKLDFEQVKWIKLPTTNRSENFLLELNQSENSVQTIEGLIFVSCEPEFYGPLCQSPCKLPSSHHRCDQLTGEIKCARGWHGEGCKNKLFISRETASMFIRRRSRRGIEELQQGNIERECIEETCTREEAREAFENDQLTADFWRIYNDPNQCIPNPCNPSNTIRCEDLVGDFRCHCKPGFDGATCAQDNTACLNEPCQNGGRCNALSPTSFSCSCSAGFEGRLCSINIDECFESDCSPYSECFDGINFFICQCDDGFTGRRCDKNIDECMSSPCRNEGTCVDHVNFYTCSCNAGYEGTNCELEINPCKDDPCLNGGVCSLTPDFNFSCSCQSNFVGKYCELSTQSVCFSMPCVNNGSCYEIMDAAAEQQTFNCSCPVGFSGPTCEKTVSPCEYETNLCPYNSTCLSLNNNYICVCPLGYVGDKCQYEGIQNQTLEALRCQETSCLNDAQCFLYENETTCVCRAGYEGDRCQTEVDHCSSFPCMNEASCVSVPTGFHCNCPEGFHGEFCEEDINECEFQPNACQNRATCENTNGSFQCICEPYHTGRLCEISFDPCQSVPCQNGGSCYKEAKSYTCECLDGYGGNQCQRVIDPCTDITNPCVNNGLCSRDPNLSYQALCSCPTGFYGRYCDKNVDNCAVTSNRTVTINGQTVPQLVERSDCGEYGFCDSISDGFRCICYPGHEGSRCEIVYETPVLNCSSLNCLCPSSLIEEVLFHNESSKLMCKHGSYSTGSCDKTTCLTQNCPNSNLCVWESECLSIYLEQNSSQRYNASSLLCPVMELTLDYEKLQVNLTVEDYCDELRNLSSYKRFNNVSLLHCRLLNATERTAQLAVAVDSITSRDQAILLAIDIYEHLKQDLDNRTKNIPTNLSSSLDSIIAIHFAYLTDNPSETTKYETTTFVTQLPYSDPFPYYYYIIIIIVFILIILLIIIMMWICCKRRQTKGEFLVSFVAQPPLSTDTIPRENELSQQSRETSSSIYSLEKNPDKSLFDDGFVNPTFGSKHDALALRKDVHSNTYVSLPYATFEPGSETNLNSNQDEKMVAKSTVDYDLTKRSKTIGEGYEFMARISAESGSFGSTSTGVADTYDYAKDPLIKSSSKQRSLGKTFHFKSSDDSNTYEEIKPKAPTAASEYEVISSIGLSKLARAESSPTFDLRSNSIQDSNPYKFASEMPAVGVPLHSPPSRSDSSIDTETNVESVYLQPTPPRGAIKINDVNQNENKMPPTNQATSKPENGYTEVRKPGKKQDLYSVPRKVKPVE